MSVGAHLGFIALLVGGATHLHTPHVWVSCVSLRTVAYRLVVVGIALGIGSTVAVVACLCLGTVVIGAASNNNRFS